MSEFTNTTFSSDAIENTETPVEAETVMTNETVIMDEVDTGLIDAEVGETTPEELPEQVMTEVSDEVADTVE